MLAPQQRVMDVSNLSISGVQKVPYQPIARRKVACVIPLWREFIKLPLETKQLIRYQPDTRMSGFGYEYKEGENGQDRKEDIHLQLAARKSLMQMARDTGERAAYEFIGESLELIGDAVRPVVADFTAAIEAYYDCPGLYDDAIKGFDKWMLRFLHYFGDCEPGHIIAAPHVDKGCFTPHLYESDPGLQYLTFDRQWKDVNLSHEETAILPGLRLQHRSQCRLTATCHQVVADAYTAVHGRVSAVCFVDTDYPFNYDKERWRSTQRQPVGFNYDRTPEELNKYFKKWD